MRIRSKTIAAALAVTGLVGVSGSVSARAMQDAPTTVVREGDETLTCRQMSDEAASLSADMGEAGPGLLGRMGGIARAGASLLLPGAGLAVAGAEALGSSGKEKREAEADTRRDRWNYLNGLYAGRSCNEGGAESEAARVPAPVSAPGSAASSLGALHGQAAVPAQVRTPSITPAAFPQ